MAEQTLEAHSLVEAVLYLMVNSCPVCRQGRLEQELPQEVPGNGTIRIVTACTNCGVTDAHLFRIDAPIPGGDPLSSDQPINTTDQTSRIIDVVQWFTLHTQLVESSRRTPDIQEARWRLLRAGQCLDEARKFYGPDDGAPPQSAVFAPGSRENLDRHSEHYSRSRLIDLKSKLPVPATGNQVKHKRRWWRFWTD